MSDKYFKLLEQYDLEVFSTFRSRGTFLCETNVGLTLLKEYRSSLRKLALEYEWKEKLAAAGFSLIDRNILTRENSLVCYDQYHTPFSLKHYFKGRECDCRNKQDVFLACRNLSLLHSVSAGIDEIPFDDLHTETIEHLFMRRNRELRKIRRYMRNIPHKNSFELKYIHSFSSFYEEAEQTFTSLSELGVCGLTVPAGVCHGAYHHHNILMLPDQNIATVNFSDICYQPFLLDLYLFLRKTMEKTHYNYDYFEVAIEGYKQHMEFSEKEYLFLYLLFLYPEKFWKISNHYFNHRKSWISPKLEEKLLKLLELDKERQIFLKTYRKTIGRIS